LTTPKTKADMETLRTPAEIEEHICDAIATFGPERRRVVRDAQLEQLEVDSLDLVELAQIIEEDLGVRVETADFAKVKTVGDVIDVVVEKTSGKVVPR